MGRNSRTGAGQILRSAGYFVEPHTGKVIPLGTREVEDYTIPLFRYDKILYVEKKGFHELFKIGNIAERYDLGIICAEGYAPDAAKLLMSRAEQTGSMMLGCLHDADPYGYNIVRRLRDLTRLQRSTINIIDFGMSLEEALELGLDTEEFIRDRELPQGLEFNEIERRYFEGVPCGWKKGRRLYRCQRVELNALASDPERFIQFVERKLAQHDGATKLVPPKKVMMEQAQLLVGGLIKDGVQKQLAELLHEDAIVGAATEKFARRIVGKDLPKEIADWATLLEAKSWDQHLLELLKTRAIEYTEALGAHILAKVREFAAKLLES